MILNHINLDNDELIKSEPVCLRNQQSKEIYCLGMLAEREMVKGKYEGKRYYQFVYFYGKSPINFVLHDYEMLVREYSFDLSLEMISDFRYSYSEFTNYPGGEKDDNLLIMQVSASWRFK
ncbi:hypothetical protein [Cytobacillus kochii]|uniref:hypothetical protein n=1 Tax=Cytobacillus kochii TaxID=859143 RepID=UPI00402A8140